MMWDSSRESEHLEPVRGWGNNLADLWGEESGRCKSVLG